MCFSAAASFVVGVPLIPAGIFCLWSAALKKPSYLGLAVVPLCFGLQQISEGFVWHGLDHGNTDQAHAASLVFLFFALAFWPCWFPILTAIMEPDPTRKWVFAGLSVACLVWFWILYFPLAVGMVSFETRVLHHSIQYLYDDLPIYVFIDKTPLRLLYFLSVALPPMLGSESWGRIPGLVLGVSALVAVAFFDYAFVSVWCFFAAGLSIYLCAVFYQLPTATILPEEAARIEEPGT
ncbi:MAG: hypothetical protein HYR84_00750 [Planctomycetes bacterium]|nr:hypothetical protein [Planctomycetota bacterium]